MTMKDKLTHAEEVVFRDHLKSALITFIAAGAVELYPIVTTLTYEQLSKSLFLTVGFVILRAGIKALIEYYFIPRK